MSEEQKPYRVYRGGRVKGKVPLDGQARADIGRRRFPRRRSQAAEAAALRPLARARSAGTRRLRARLARRLLLQLPQRRGGRERPAAAERRGVADRAERPPHIAPDAGAPARHGRRPDRRARRRAPRRLDHGAAHRPEARTGSPTSRSRATCCVAIPGYGEEKINSAFQLGGPALAIKTVRALTGLEVNHVVIVDFADFKQPDRRARRDRRRRPEPDPLEPLRLPVHGGSAARPGRAGASSKGTAAHGRPAGARLLADPREPARPSRQRLHARRAPAGGDRRR